MNKSQNTFTLPVIILLFLILGSVITVVFAGTTGKLDFSKSELASAIKSEQYKNDQLKADQNNISTYSNNNYPQFSFKYNKSKVIITEVVEDSDIFDDVQNNTITVRSKDNSNASFKINISTINNTGFVGPAPCGFIQKPLLNDWSKVDLLVLDENQDYIIKSYYLPKTSFIEKSLEFYPENDQDLAIKFDDMKICATISPYIIESKFTNEERGTILTIEPSTTTDDIIEEVIETIKGLTA